MAEHPGRFTDFSSDSFTQTKVTVGRFFTLSNHPYSKLHPRSSSCLPVVLRSEADQEVLVEHRFVLDGEEHRCAAPFSWLLTLHLESLWEESEFIPGLSCLEIQKCRQY